MLWKTFCLFVCIPSRVNFINILCSIFLPISFHQKITKPKCSREKLQEALLYEKCVSKMLMKLTPCFNFINILHTIFLYKSLFKTKL